jgi:NADPH:quinone reductase-like Zn-dependent oxidoreductase
LRPRHSTHSNTSWLTSISWADAPRRLGLDLSGIVIAAGHGVRGVVVGDAVAAMADLNGNGGWSTTGESGGEGG